MAGKIRDYFHGIWNKIDFIIFLLFATAVVMKNFYYTFEYSRILFCVNNFLFFFRGMRFYHASAAVGPKLIIIFTMVIKLTYCI